MANRIILGESGQTIRHVPTGVVSAASYAIEDLDVSPENPDRVIASGEPTVANWSLVTTAVAGPTQPHAGRMYVQATAGAGIGDPAVILAPDGSRELLEIEGIAAGSYVQAASALAGVYPIGSTVRGVLVSASIPDVFAADEARFKLGHRYRVTWTYTLDGSVRRVPERLDWVRHNVAADQIVGEALLWLSKAYPRLREGLPDHMSLDAVAECMAGEVANDLRAKDIDPSTFLVGERATTLISWRILSHMGEHGWSPGNVDPDRWGALAAKRYTDRLNSLTIGTAGQGSAETDARTDTAKAVPGYRAIFSEM